jgi:hypothetical protein
MRVSMRHVIVSELLTLDGSSNRPARHPGWTMAYRVPELHAYKLQGTLELTHLEGYDSGVLLRVNRPVEAAAPSSGA